RVLFRSEVRERLAGAGVAALAELQTRDAAEHGLAIARVARARRRRAARRAADRAQAVGQAVRRIVHAAARLDHAPHEARRLAVPGPPAGALERVADLGQRLVALADADGVQRRDLREQVRRQRRRVRAAGDE